MKASIICLILALGLIQVESAKYVRTPHGLGWDECGYTIPSGSHVEVTEEGETVVTTPDGSKLQHPPCPKPFIYKRRDLSGATKQRDSPDDGWQIWTSFNNKDNDTFNSFLGYFNVPNEPKNFDGGILYMFTGLQNDNWIPYPSNASDPPVAFDIIQPVLQYGNSPIGGGNFWGVASWYVTVFSNWYASTLLQLNAGDTIFGNMTKTGATSWFISSYSESMKTNTSMTYNDPRLIAQPWAYCTLEVYEIDDCASDFPSSPLKFTKLALTGSNNKQVIPRWEAFDNGVDHCGASATVNSATAVTFNFS